LGQVPIHGVRLVKIERAVAWRPAHEAEAVGVPVIPVVAATANFEPLDTSRAAVPRGPGGQLWPSADEPLLLPVPLPFGYAGPHAVVVRPEVLVPDDQGGVRGPELAPATSAPVDGFDLLVDDARPTHQPQHQGVVAHVRT